MKGAVTMRTMTKQSTMNPKQHGNAGFKPVRFSTRPVPASSYPLYPVDGRDSRESFDPPHPGLF
jgi:hypothetical protein